MSVVSLTVSLTEQGEQYVVTAPGYSISVNTDPAILSVAPYARLANSAGQRWSKLSLLASVATTAGHDETIDVTSVTAQTTTDAAVLLSITFRSSLWLSRVLELHCTSTGIAVRVVVEGDGLIDDVLLLGGEATLEGGACGVFRSSIKFSSVLVPVPTEPVQFIRPSHSAASLGVVGDADAGRLNGIFSPPPLVFGLGKSAPSISLTSATVPPDGEWLALSVRASVAEMTFTTVRYEPLDGGFLLRLGYEGHTRAVGRWTSPQLVIIPVASGWDVIDAHRDDLVAHGHAPAPRRAEERWWGEPLFCGWGAQCARGAIAGRPEELDSSSAIDQPGHLFATEELYGEFLTVLDGAGLEPGTIVIDDRWQQHYGTASPDHERWPDLKRWIADQHSRGRKVLLWWKAWDPEGLPADECVTDAAGRPIAVDPANPAYLERLRDIVTGLLEPDGMDADGLKVDFTQRAPSGRSLKAHDGVWGIAALHAMLATIYSAAHAAKPDALIVTHAVHPSFADVGDMVRLNDVLERDVLNAPVGVVDQLRARHEIAVRSQPDAPIDTDQWPMPNKTQWLEYVDAQEQFGAPALYYVESIDRTGERIDAADLARVADSWRRYRERTGRATR